MCLTFAQHVGIGTFYNVETVKIYCENKHKVKWGSLGLVLMNVSSNGQSTTTIMDRRKLVYL
ncbi:hypothetical protein HanIR_Chr02g0068801 [Helianthus annuus]|nr:hypothetical protein HanIR_Chr02g0068801 [Helianthus annuus]